MQSSQDLNTSVSASLQEPADMDSIDDEKEASEDFEEITYDILECFPILLCQYVFQHLNGKELLEMSTVNREWNKLVGEKAQAEKLKLVIDQNRNKKLTRKAKQILMSSKRKYQNIEVEIAVDYDNDLDSLLLFLAHRAGSWKSFDIKIRGLRCNWSKILEIIEPTVEELSIFYCNRPGNPSKVDLSWTFPRLKYLACNVHHHNIFKHFGRVTSLVEFHWQLPLQKTEEAIKDLRTMLRNNQNLKEMRCDYAATLMEHPKEIKFKLQKLSIERFYDDLSTERFFPFLQTQAQTLESLEVHTPLNMPLLELILGMPKLTSLKTLGMTWDETQELQVKSSITTLELMFEANEQESIKTLTRSMLSLKHLKCYKIDDEMLLSLAQDVPALESLKVECFNVSRIPEENIFPKIKKFRAKEFHRDLQEPTDDHNFTKLVKREMRRSNAVE